MRHTLSSLCLLLIIGLPIAAVGQDAATRSQDGVQGLPDGAVELLDTELQPGDYVKVRLRDAALAWLLEHPDDWSVSSAGQEIPAILMHAPETSQSLLSILQIIDGGRPEQQDRVVIIDRGSDPADFDTMQLSFSSTDVLTTVIPAAGPTQEDFSQRGEEQLVLQKVTEDGVLRLTEISFSPLPINRYIRLTIRNGADHALAELSCSKAAVQPVLHEVPVALGPMRSLPAGGGSIWPLILTSNMLPLQKLKIVSDAPGQYRRIRFVRLDENQRELYREAEMVFADGLSANGVVRTENYIQLSGDMSSQQAALIVEDGEGTVLPIKSVQAYASEVYVCFSWPQSGSPVLRSLPPRDPLQEFPFELAGLAGTISSISADQEEIEDSGEEEISNKRGTGTGWLAELELDRYLPSFSVSYRELLPAAGVLMLLGLVLLLAARRSDIRG